MSHCFYFFLGNYSLFYQKLTLGWTVSICMGCQQSKKSVNIFKNPECHPPACHPHLTRECMNTDLNPSQKGRRHAYQTSLGGNGMHHKKPFFFYKIKQLAE